MTAILACPVAFRPIRNGECPLSGYVAHPCSRCPTRRRGWGEPNRDPRQHDRWQREVKRRDRHTCRRCGWRSPDGRGLVAHHVVGIAQGGAPYDVGNGITLCQSCHREVDPHGR